MPHYQPRCMLVTGGAGFIGAHFIHYIQEAAPHVVIINLDKFTYAGSLAHLSQLPHPEKHIFVRGDINDASQVQAVLESYSIDTIVHFAAETHVDRSIATPELFIKNNIHGTFTLLEAARQQWFEKEKLSATACRFHHISTDEVYGSLTTLAPAFTEVSPYEPRSPYSASKASADHIVRAYYHTYGLPITLSLCSNNYGPYQHAEKFIPTIISRALKQQAIPIYGQGNNIRDWLYVKDHCRGIMRIIEEGKAGESYHLGAHNEWDNLSLAKLICDLLDQSCPAHFSYASLLHYVEDRQGHDFRYAMNTQKIKNELGWTPQETFESGLKKTLQFYLQYHEREMSETPSPYPLPSLTLRERG